MMIKILWLNQRDRPKRKLGWWSRRVNRGTCHWSLSSNSELILKNHCFRIKMMKIEALRRPKITIEIQFTKIFNLRMKQSVNIQNYKDLIILCHLFLWIFKTLRNNLKKSGLLLRKLRKNINRVIDYNLLDRARENWRLRLI